MSRPSSAKNFKALKDKWYAKLKNSGFRDVERADGTLEFRADSNLRIQGRITKSEIEARQEYYRLAGQFLFDYAFSSPTEKRIWELHAEGATVRDISDLLRKRSITLKKTAVNDTIHRLAKVMLRRHKGQI